MPDDTSTPDDTSAPGGTGAAGGLVGLPRAACRFSPPAQPPREAEYAARWATGWWRGRVLRTERGDVYTVIYEGRRGGGAGPDFRDAVLARADGTRICGDVELHLRSTDWRAHGHDGDRRYAGVVLHIVFSPLSPHAPGETPLPLGGRAPIAVLQRDPVPAGAPRAAGPWPCSGLASRLRGKRLRALLLEAGLERYALRESMFMREIAARVAAQPLGASRWAPHDRVLFVAIAEALAYGRDREALRAAGEALLPAAAGDRFESLEAGSETEALPVVERARLSGLVALRARWLAEGPWMPLRDAIVRGSSRSAARHLTTALRVDRGRVSPGRAAIVAANVVLPFAGALGTLDGDEPLRARTRSLFEALPGLPSNTITRLMARQLGLVRLPAGACAQQGLHHIWSEWCREKHCASCPCASAAPDVPAHRDALAKSDTLSQGAGSVG